MGKKVFSVKFDIGKKKEEAKARERFVVDDKKNKPNFTYDLTNDKAAEAHNKEKEEKTVDYIAKHNKTVIFFETFFSRKFELFIEENFFFYFQEFF